MPLLLFDIDGTLVDAFGAGRKAVEDAFRDVTGSPVDSGGFSFSGKTDPQIVRDLLKEHGFPDDGRTDLDALTERVLDRYAERLAVTIAEKRVEALPGTSHLLGALTQHDDLLLGLLTGNLERTAHLKLSGAGLADVFDSPPGAFGSDDADRDRLVPVATRRAEEQTGRAFSGGDIVVIGDTPRDVACGQAHSARTVGVCTGRYDRADLEDAGADLILDDLTDAERFVEEVV